MRALLPARFRKSYADELLLTHVDRMPQTHGIVAIVKLWFAVTCDVAATAVAARTDAALRRLPSLTVTAFRRTWDALRMDTRYAVRQLVRSPVFTIVASVSLAVGIGVTVAGLAVLKAVLFQPLPVADPAHLYRVYTGYEAGQTPRQFGATTYPDFLAYQASGLFADAAAVDPRSGIVTGLGRQAESQKVEYVTHNYFNLLGITPQRGRWLSTEPAREIVVTEYYWKHALAGDTAVLGRVIRIDGNDHRIVGVGPSGFGGISSGDMPAGWIDARTFTGYVTSAGGKLLTDVTSPSFGVVARLKPGLTMAAAQQRLTALADAMARTNPDRRMDARGKSYPISILSDRQARVLPDRRTGTYAAFGVGGILVLVVLLIGCANVAGFLLARTMARQHEVGVRLILGAGRRRMFVQLFTESVLLSLVGGALGCFGAWMALQYALQYPEAASIGIRIDAGMVLIALSVSFGTALLFGLAPILQSLRVERRLATSSTHTAPISTNRARGRVLSTQVAASFVLVVIAMVALKSVREQLAVEPGFDTDGVIVGEFPQVFNPDTAAASAFVRGMLDMIARTPGVLTVGVGSQLPLDKNWWTSPMKMPNGEMASWEMTLSVDPGYLPALGVEMLRGRHFAWSDTATASPVAIVNEVYARGHQVGIGDYIEGGSPKKGAPPVRIRIIGIARTVVSHHANELPQQLVYVPRQPSVSQWGSNAFVVRVSRGNEDAVVHALTAAAASRWPERRQPVIRTMAQYIRASTIDARILSSGALAIGAVELSLAAVGLYGILLYSVLARWRELGVRLALGAERRQAIWSVLSQPLRSALIGLAAGAVLVVPVLQFVRRSVSAAKLTDPLPFAIATVVVVGGVSLAALIPARRAASINPATALRHE
jgi:predicted permease